MITKIQHVHPVIIHVVLVINILRASHVLSSLIVNLL